LAFDFARPRRISRLTAEPRVERRKPSDDALLGLCFRDGGTPIVIGFPLGARGGWRRSGPFNWLRRRLPVVNGSEPGHARAVARDILFERRELLSNAAELAGGLRCSVGSAQFRSDTQSSQAREGDESQRRDFVIHGWSLLSLLERFP
jgi:hypothetical protein